jgi:hypothetical protein
MNKIEWNPEDDGPNTIEVAYVDDLKLIVSYDDESVFAHTVSYYWLIERDGVTVTDGWTGDPKVSKREAIKYAKEVAQ